MSPLFYVTTKGLEMYYRFLAIFILISTFVVSGCGGYSNSSSGIMYDPHSYANFNDAIIKHMDMDLNVDFSSQQIHAKIKYTIENKTGTDKLILDSRNLKIETVTIGQEETPTTFMTGDFDKMLGEPLEININPSTEIVTIEYSTSPDALSLQWLEPELTSDGKHPFVYSDNQPIMARSWLPCMDSPGVRQTYNAVITTTPGLMAVMSGKNSKEKNSDGVYSITMEQPIPSYLIAIAAGDFEYRSLGPRSGVYAESSVIDAATWEFAETEKMIAAAEKLYGPYRWDDYNMIIMPKSYPMGGMENPRVNFITPTIISGDRSLLNLIAHELAHSWSGNLVTNANWNDLWLNEGFTSYFEHRIMEEVYGRDYQQMLAALDQEGLRHVISKAKDRKELTKLHLDLKGIDPEVNSGLVAYEKGTFFLTLLEETIGREKWDSFLRQYFDEFAFKSTTSQKFVEYLRENLIKGDKELEDKLRIDEWVYEPGIPSNMIDINSPEFAKVNSQIEKWLNGTPASSLETNNWTTHHWLHFIRHIPWDLTHEQLTDLDNAFGFTATGNSEILNSWLLRAIHNKYAEAYPALKDFLQTVGRRKFLRPLYSKLAETPEGLELAQEIYSKARSGYHATARQSIDPVVKWQEIAAE